MTNKQFDINKVRLPLDLEIQEGLFISKGEDILDRNFDFDVFLPSIGKNLQRGFVWTLEQKQEFIISCIKGLYIPPYSFVIIIKRTDNTREDIYQVIDGKQRLSTIISFYKNEFPIIIDGIEFFYKDLDDKGKYHLGWGSAIKGNLAYHYETDTESKNNITDEKKINWFRMLNFAGTPIEKEHIENLLKVTSN